MQGNDTINFYKKYFGSIIDSIDYPIKDICIVKADIVEFADLHKTFLLLESKNNKK